MTTIRTTVSRDRDRTTSRTSSTASSAARSPAPDDGGDNGQVQESLGSGFIVDAKGYIITNDHVIDKADKIYVKLSTDPDTAGPWPSRPRHRRR